MHESVSCELLLTGSCNLRCDYCIARNLPEAPMDEGTGRRAIDFFIYLATGAKTVEFTFTGGEPLTVFPTLTALTEHASRRTGEAGMMPAFVLKTNGTILNAAIVDFLKSHGFKVVISIDGASPMHDAHRRTLTGQRTHSRVCRNLLSLLDKRVSCVASMTVHPSVCSALAEGVRFLHSLGSNCIDIGPAYGTVEWRHDQIQEFTSCLLDAASYVRQVIRAGGALDVGPFYRESEHVGGILADRWGCHAASSHLAVLPDGRISGCSALAMLAHRLPEFILGDVFGGLRQDATDHMICLAQARAEDRVGCLRCEARDNCTGGCLAINYATTGRPLSPPRFYCDTISALPSAWKKAWQ